MDENVADILAEAKFPVYGHMERAVSRTWFKGKS
jgi:hypothetical protein